MVVVVVSNSQVLYHVIIEAAFDITFLPKILNGYDSNLIILAKTISMFTLNAENEKENLK